MGSNPVSYPNKKKRGPNASLFCERLPKRSRNGGTEASEETQTEIEPENLDVSGIEAALLNLTADSFTDELPTEVEEIGLTLHLDNENFPTVEVRLYRYDGSLCLAVVDGDPVSLVTRSSVMELVEAVQAIVLNG